MPEIGKINTLTVVKHCDFGIYLDGGELGEILLPARYVPADCEDGSLIEVFLYLDSSDTLIATTETPRAKVGQFAWLPVISVTAVGAFLDWGLPKDLLVPFREQRDHLEEGKSYLVYVYLDPVTNRIAATTRIARHLDDHPTGFKTGQEVDILVCEQTEIGFKTIVDNRLRGMLYTNELYKEVRVGMTVRGYVKKIREDNKLDLSLSRPGYDQVTDLAGIIIEQLKRNDGYLDLTDKSSPELIAERFQTSKKSFKKAIGNLYRQHLITLEKDGIRLTAN